MGARWRASGASPQRDAGRGDSRTPSTGAPRLDGDHALHGSGHRDAGMPRRVTVAISRRPGGSRLRQAPGSAELLSNGAGAHEGIGLRAGPDPLHALVGDTEEGAAGILRVDHAGPLEIYGGAGDGEERGRNEAARGGLGHAHSMAQAREERSGSAGERSEIGHAPQSATNATARLR